MSSQLIVGAKNVCFMKCLACFAKQYQLSPTDPILELTALSLVSLVSQFMVNISLLNIVIIVFNVEMIISSDIR